MGNVIFSINGGIGKCIAATAVCSAIKKKYPNEDLIVVSGYPEVFIGNPNVKKTFAFGNLNYFYQDYIENKEVEVFLQDPYLTTDYIKESKHLIQLWCELFGLEYKGEMPEMFLTKREIEFFQKQVQVEKPIMMLQSNGGADANKKYSFARDLPSSVVTKVVNHFKDKYVIFHVRRDDQIGYQDTIKVSGQLREILAISMLSQKRLLIDSFMQHSMAALNMPSSVCWITNNPKVLGYEMHDNILANPFTIQPELRGSYLSKFDISGNPLEFPYNSEDEIFDVDKIIASLEK